MLSINTLYSLIRSIDIYPSKGSVAAAGAGAAAAAAAVVQIGLSSTDGDLISSIAESFSRGVHLW